MSAPAFDFKDHVVVVTGAGAGIGQGIAQAFHVAGARVALGDLREAPLKQAAGKLGAERVFAQAVDVRDEGSVASFVAAAEKQLGGVGVLVANAGIYPNTPVVDMDVEEWDQVMAVNLRGLFLCSRAVFPAMKAQGKGVIVNISSSTFFKGVPDYIHYTTSKGGVVGFTRSLARELGPHGIRVNALAPGFTLSGENEKNISEERKRFNLESRMLKRAEVPEDLVGTLVYLVSDDSVFMSGQTLLVDGGGSVH